MMIQTKSKIGTLVQKFLIKKYLIKKILLKLITKENLEIEKNFPEALNFKRKLIDKKLIFIII